MIQVLKVTETTISSQATLLRVPHSKHESNPPSKREEHSYSALLAPLAN